MPRIPRAYLELSAVLVCCLSIPFLPVIVVAVAFMPQPIPFIAGSLAGAFAVCSIVRLANRNNNRPPPDAP
ncbi:MAG TPA: hypothetical protein VGM05_21135 [Planctomycetaceae bacterium]